MRWLIVFLLAATLLIMTSCTIPLAQALDDTPYLAEDQLVGITFDWDKVNIREVSLQPYEQTTSCCFGEEPLEWEYTTTRYNYLVVYDYPLGAEQLLLGGLLIPTERFSWERVMVLIEEAVIE